MTTIQCKSVNGSISKCRTRHRARLHAAQIINNILVSIRPLRYNRNVPEKLQLHTFFMIVWVCLGLGSFLFFHFNRNAVLKRQVWPAFILTVGSIFGGFMYYMLDRQQPQVLYFMVPAIILISFLNIRMTRFCDSCGRTLYRQPIFSRIQFCPHCGAELK